MYLLPFTVGCILGLFLKVLYEKTTPVVAICITPHSSSYPAQKPPFSTAGETPSTHWYIHASWNVFRPELWPQHTHRVILFPAKQDESHLKARCLYATGITVHKCVCTWMCWFIWVHLSACIFVCWMWCIGQKKKRDNWNQRLSLQWFVFVFQRAHTDTEAAFGVNCRTNMQPRHACTHWHCSSFSLNLISTVLKLKVALCLSMLCSWLGAL